MCVCVCDGGRGALVCVCVLFVTIITNCLCGCVRFRIIKSSDCGPVPPLHLLVGIGLLCVFVCALVRECVCMCVAPVSIVYAPTSGLYKPH